MIANLRKFVSFLLYLNIRFVIKKKFNKTYLNQNVKIIENTGSNSFFGYYNISPFGKDDYILSHNYLNDTPDGYLFDRIELFSKRISSEGSDKYFGNSEAWNWQQGSMMQWFNKNENKIILNDYDRSKREYYSKVVNDYGKIIAKFELPYYALAKNCSYFLTLNYDRLALLRPDYGYFCKNSSIIKLPDFRNDGIWKYNIDSNFYELIITFNDLLNLKYDETMNTDMHKVNHIDISPNSQHFMFLHRWFQKNIKYTRLIVSDADGKNLKVLCGNKMVSHCTWRGSYEIVGFCHQKSHGDKYYTFDIRNGNSRVFYPELLTEDGHPSFDMSMRFFLTDTYPRRDRFSKLLLLDTKSDKLYVLGEFFQPRKYKGPFRIDLHPRFNDDGTLISIDSGHMGKRQQHILDISKFIKQLG